ncbi:SDR family NAD(P)-dependent oxidoreductase [Brevibacterium sp. SMBL_HHYL_HB1]|uniref:SDR family NAD(P)-dependent oxidoreductase n=1 Tax=Brevibacterium sp. SMBL_HHYL_HB1 TaxID=2777556 RepID=UPI001BA821A0|nr:SDR family NAD(P)-dependent oxidoreductase [Brevibacterium sp. SMBL_HHYL_HB1]QUL78391.1 SDR family NAD(P)-dependent oxidoreductase [Brevibacterium sp. SMBL_HHYL_HB1]
MIGSGTSHRAVVAVTGGAHGIGQAIARRFAASGAQVAIGDTDRAAAREAAEEPGLHAYGLDVTDAESFADFLDAVRQDLGPVDVLVNNAGLMWVGSFEEEPESAARAQLSVNLLGVINGIKAAAPAMRRARRGHLITVASAASILPTPGEATYAATKHGVLGYLKAVRTELRGSGVEVTAVMPAVVAAVDRPRFEITVPAYIGPLTRMAELLPQAMRDRLFAAMVPDQVAEVRAEARAGYEGSFTIARPPRTGVGT